MDIREAIAQVTSRHDLKRQEMVDVMNAIMSGDTTDAQNAAFLVGLQMKGIRPAELLGGATVMRQLVTQVPVTASEHLVDTCGTGGSGTNKFNVSTAAAFVAACAGCRVAKHGNRSATSASGSADLLEVAGMRLDLSPEQVAACIEEVGVGFMFAPAHHSAMKHVITARKEIGIRTIFNLLGPLTNPALAPNQVIGVFDGDWIPTILNVLQELGSRHVLVVAADDGLDEITIAGATRVGELRNGSITEYSISPKDFGMQSYTETEMLRIDSPQASLALVRDALSYANQPAADIVALNAGAAIYAAGIQHTMGGGVKQAVGILKSGEALDKLQALADFTQGLGN